MNDKIQVYIIKKKERCGSLYHISRSLSVIILSSVMHEYLNYWYRKYQSRKIIVTSVTLTDRRDEKMHRMKPTMPMTECFLCVRAYLALCLWSCALTAYHAYVRVWVVRHLSAVIYIEYYYIYRAQHGENYGARDQTQYPSMRRAGKRIFLQ